MVSYPDKANGWLTTTLVDLNQPPTRMRNVPVVNQRFSVKIIYKLSACLKMQLVKYGQNLTVAQILSSANQLLSVYSCRDNYHGLCKSSFLVTTVTLSSVDSGVSLNGSLPRA